MALWSACKPSVPAEPTAPTQAPPSRPADSTHEYRPALDAALLQRVHQALREQAQLDDAAVPEQPTEPRRITVGGVSAVDTIVARVGPRWIGAAIERDRVSIGLAGAERIYQLREQAQRPMSAAELTRTVGLLEYYPYTVFDGTEWSQTPHQTAAHARAPGAVPTLTPRQQGGRDLMFSYDIPDGMPGAGAHFGHIRVTDSMLLIDVAPHPERR